MKLKKLCALILALAMVFALAACGESSNTNANAGSNTNANSSTGTNAGTSGTANTSENSSGNESAGYTGKTYELALSMHDGANTLKGQYMQEWADKVNAASGGAVNITVYAGGALASQETVVEAMQTGACDIAMVYTTSYEALFPLTNGIGLPMLGMKSAQDATKVLWDLYEQSPEMAAEYDDYVLVHMYSNGTAYMMFGNEPINSYDGIQGKKIRSAGGAMTAFLTACGAVPMTIGASEVYESLEKGLIDGNIGTGSQVKSWNLGEVDHYFMDMPLYVGVWLTLMNKSTYESLPDEAKAAIQELSGEEYSLTMADYLQGESDEAYAGAVSGGTSEWVEVSADEQAKFYNAALGYNESWIESHTTADFDAQAYYDLILSCAAAYQ